MNTLLRFLVKLGERRPKYDVATWVHREEVVELSYRVVVIFYDDEKHQPVIDQSLKDDMLDIIDEHERSANSDISHARFVLALRKRMDGMDAVPVRRAAEIVQLGLSRVYKLIEVGKLEGVHKKGKLWVTWRSLSRFLVYEYHGTSDFNAPRETFRNLIKPARK